jgi:hypothetical protein
MPMDRGLAPILGRPSAAFCGGFQAGDLITGILLQVESHLSRFSSCCNQVHAYFS